MSDKGDTFIVKQTKRYQIVQYPTAKGPRQRKVMHKRNYVVWDRPVDGR